MITVIKNQVSLSVYKTADKVVLTAAMNLSETSQRIQWYYVNGCVH